ncbi:hypothetical protein NE237_008606 [Protea cynaroides]|uniref:Omega-hydroxypalmitate O-feruloyl transferase n=1 Tax=Protea cynaroides TaxID=273540 RepID=A0A9Q0KX14_9MAGN|nr:hypothetical protein NE237_008606 [Protea cynaroides]
MENTNTQVKEAVLVTPSEPTPTHVLSLSALDSQLFLRFTIEYLLVYRSRSITDRSATKARLKAALSQALVPYYPLAGRVRAARPDGSNLEVFCAAQGAVFIEAVTDIPAADLEGAPRYSTQWRNLLSFHVSDVLKGSPPLVIQLTWLPEGAAAVAVGISHCICDGIGSADFLNSFADLATRRRGIADLKPKPIWNRHLLDPVNRTQHQRSPAACHPEFNPVQDLSGFVHRFSRESLTPTSFTFDQRALLQLKKLASPMTRPNERSYTSFEVLSAHVWRSWARALQLPGTQTLRLLFSVNIRNRVKPNLPEGYYGNGLVLGCAQTGAKELVENGLGWAAGLLRRAKEKVGDEYVRRVEESVSGSGLRACPDSVGVLIVSQWSRLGLERVDIGLGKPIHVGPVCTDRYCLFLPVHERKDAVKVMVALPYNAVEKYCYFMTNTSC